MVTFRLFGRVWTTLKACFQHKTLLYRVCKRFVTLFVIFGTFQKKVSTVSRPQRPQSPPASTSVHGPKSVRTCFTCSEPQPRLVFDKKHRRHCLCEFLNDLWYYCDFWKKCPKKCPKWTHFSKKCPRRTLFFSGHIFSILTYKKGLFSTLGPCFSPLPCVFLFKLI